MANQNTATSVRTDEKTSAVAAAGLAVIVGLFLVFAAGFAQPQAIHNAAHDGRHSTAFPCH